MDNKLKHLEFIQNVITRMNSNSFLIKGWTITIVSALFALSAKDSNLKFAMVSYICIPAFWILDGFFVAFERRYRDLYKKISAKADIDIDFIMDVSEFNKNDRTWISGILSKTLLIFYSISVATTLIVMFLLK